MNLRQLETFVAIVRCGSFSKAADLLNSTQSTVSARIQELEQDLGVALFDRATRRPLLTEKGRELIAYAERAIDLMSDIRLKVGNSREYSGVVRIGIPEIVAVTWLPDFVATVRARYPKLVLQLEVALNPHLISALGSGGLDIAIIAGSGAELPFAWRDLGVVRFAWMASGNVKLPSRIWTPRDLAELPMIHQGSDSATRQLMRSWLGGQFDREPHSICNSMGAIASLAAAGVGIGFLPLDYHADRIASGNLQVLQTDPIVPCLPFSIVYPSRQNASIAQKLAELAVQSSSFEFPPRNAPRSFEKPDDDAAVRTARAGASTIRARRSPRTAVEPRACPERAFERLRLPSAG